MSPTWMLFKDMILKAWIQISGASSVTHHDQIRHFVFYGKIVSVHLQSLKQMRLLVGVGLQKPRACTLIFNI